MKNLRTAAAASILLGVTGCAALQNIADNAPPAETPTNVNVLAILDIGGGWVNVGRSVSGTYKILPGGLPSGGIRLYFYAPYPSTLLVGIDGVSLPKFEDIPSGTDPAMTGYYRILNINANLSTPYWTVGVRAPTGKLASTGYLISIADVSINPKYRDAAGNNQVSPPLTINAAAQDKFTVTVIMSGSGQGRVTSNPAGVNCEVSCTTDFIQSVSATVDLHANSASGSSSFGGWSGACTGTSPCSVHLNGTAVAVTALFNRSSGSPSMQSCPAPSPPAGYSYFSQPHCALQNAFNDPAPDLTCDSQGYFCCAMQNGVNSPRCGNDHVAFPADCNYCNPNVRIEPSGCYIKD
jgi:hypothetical protein